MGIADVINEGIRGKETWQEKSKREIWQKKQGIKTTEELVKGITNESKAKNKLKTIYKDLIKILKKYLDLREDYYPLIAIWIMGTYTHDDFETYPYLFLNAMRGSAKTRLLKLIACLSKNGEVLASLSEAVLFRTAKGKTICIDEFERVTSKEKQALRELLNGAYKKGIKVKRMKKRKFKEGEEQVVEEFDVYCPIVMANIWGIEEVLGDRCIQCILERSNDPFFTKKMEIFDKDEDITTLKDFLLIDDKGVVMQFLTPKTTYTLWNNYIANKYYTKLHYTHTTETTLTALPLFKKIDKANINGRDLELFFPLFIISSNISNKILNKMIEIAKKITQEKSIDQLVESRDISLIDFISQQIYIDFVPILELTKKFKDFLKEEQEETKWINTKWIGRALKRLNLVKEKRRLGRGIEIIPNTQKAQKKIKMFKPVGK